MSNHSYVDKGKFEGFRNVRNLLAQGAAVNAKNSDGWTPLMQAVIFSDDSIAKELLDLLMRRSADPSLTNNMGKTVRDIAFAIHGRSGRPTDFMNIIDSYATTKPD